MMGLSMPAVGDAGLPGPRPRCAGSTSGPAVRPSAAGCSASTWPASAWRRRDAAGGAVQRRRRRSRRSAASTSRLAHFLSTSLPGCGEQAVAKVLSVAAGVVVAAATVIPGIGPFADAPPAGAGAARRRWRWRRRRPGRHQWWSATAATGRPATLKSLLGNAVPADWSPHRSQGTTEPTAIPRSDSGSNAPARITPLRDAVAAARSSDRPTLPQGRCEPRPAAHDSLLPPGRDRTAGTAGRDAPAAFAPDRRPRATRPAAGRPAVG